MITNAENVNCKFEKNKQPNRNASYDLLKIMATFAVILIHANWLYFADCYEVYSSDISWIMKSLINIITRFSVPCFVMISGACNLNKGVNANMKDFYQKTSFRIFLPFAIVLLLEALATFLMNLVLHRELNCELDGFFTMGIYNLWYMYMLFGIYLLTPFIVKLKTVLSCKAYRFLAVWMFIWAIISQSTSTQKMAYSIGVVGAFLGYYLMGDMIRSEISKCSGESKKRIVLCSSIVSLFAVAVTFWVRAMGINYYVENWSINFFSPTIVILSISVFLMFNIISIHVREGLYWLSKRTFYIYLFHTMILRFLHHIIKQRIENELLAATILILLTIVLSLLAAICFEKIWNFICLKLSMEEKWKHMRIWRG